MENGSRNKAFFVFLSFPFSYFSFLGRLDSGYFHAGWPRCGRLSERLPSDLVAKDRDAGLGVPGFKLWLLLNLAH